MVAVRMRDLSRALGELDDDSRSLLELSLRRGTADDEIAAALPAVSHDVGRRRAELLEQLASELKLDGRAERDELFATLQDLPADLWPGS